MLIKFKIATYRIIRQRQGLSFPSELEADFAQGMILLSLRLLYFSTISCSITGEFSVLGFFRETVVYR